MMNDIHARSLKERVELGSKLKFTALLFDDIIESGSEDKRP
jgi:hypothetical protein